MMSWLKDDDERNDFFTVYLFIELRFYANFNKVKSHDYKFYDDEKLK